MRESEHQVVGWAAQIGSHRRRVEDIEQIDVGVEQGVVVHRRQRQAGSEQTAENLIQETAIDLQEPRTDGKFRECGLARHRRRADRKIVQSRQRAPEKQLRARLQRHASGVGGCGGRRFEAVLRRERGVRGVRAQFDVDGGVIRIIVGANGRVCRLRRVIEIAHGRQRRQIGRALRLPPVGEDLAEVDAQRSETHDHGQQQRRENRDVAAPVARKPARSARQMARKADRCVHQ